MLHYFVKQIICVDLLGLRACKHILSEDHILDQHILFACSNMWSSDKMCFVRALVNIFVLRALVNIFVLRASGNVFLVRASGNADLRMLILVGPPVMYFFIYRVGGPLVNASRV